MRCEEAQEHLALDTDEPALHASIAAHVAGCDACRSTGLFFSKVNETLRSSPAWIPPRDFAQRVTAQAVSVQISVPASRSSQNVWGGVALGVLTAVAVWGIGRTTATHEQWASDLSRAIVANSVAVAWTSMLFALGVAAWFTRRAVK